MIGNYAALTIFILAAFVGYEVISRVPVILHTPLMSGSNFVHGIVVVGAIVTLSQAHTTPERTLGFVAVLLGAANVVGGYAVTERMLQLFRASKDRRASDGAVSRPSPDGAASRPSSDGAVSGPSPEDGTGGPSPDAN